MYNCKYLVALIVLFTVVKSGAATVTNAPLRLAEKNRAALLQVQDTLPVQEDSIVYYDANLNAFSLGRDTVHLARLTVTPYISVQQALKGLAPSVYVKESSGEPGSYLQQMFIRGLGKPLTSFKDVYETQPAVYVNGIPLLQDNPFLRNIQVYDVNPIGPATNLLTYFDFDNVEKINVVKDFKDAGVLGPLVSNGAVYITTKNAKPGVMKADINTYYGFVTMPRITTTNGEYEKNFRLPFYNKYATVSEFESFPSYLSDSSSLAYYGPSNWTDEYYKSTPVYNVNGSLTGGSQRANFRVFGGLTSNPGVAEKTKLDRYNLSLYLNMLPVSWLTISTSVSGVILNRDRNKSFTDRFAEMRYLPNLTNPLAPNKAIYQSYLKQYTEVLDDNSTLGTQGYFSATASFGGFAYTARIAFDYNEGRRDLFFPTTLFDGNNYASNFFGYNQRLIIDNVLSYTTKFSNQIDFKAEAGGGYNGDVQQYNYIYGYNGPNDFIKVIFLKDGGFETFTYTDKIQQRLLSVYGKAGIKVSKKLDMSLLVRNDGSSSVSPSERWFASPIFDGTYHFFANTSKKVFSTFDVNFSIGRLGNVLSNGSYGAGTQYNSAIGWAGYPTMVSYNGIGAYTRPYTFGWIRNDMPWSYTQQVNAGALFGFFKNKLTLKLDWYRKDNKNIAYQSPTVSETGYKYEIKTGMWVRNAGIDANITATIADAEAHAFGWMSSLNVNYNKNKLVSLGEDGATSLTINGRRFEVGKPIDQFYLLTNIGIYNSDGEVPVNPVTGKRLNYKGIEFAAGDARWVDMNGDYTIDDKDKVMTGNYMPKIFGGFSNQFLYKGFDLSIDLYFALGQKILNQYASNYYNFINVENSNTLNSVKEITFWEQRVKPDAYTMYNPWSLTVPYQTEQNMFLEDGSFLKLRAATLGYRIKTKKSKKEFAPRGYYIYVTGTNLWTWTKYSGRDPELTDYNGYDTGYGMMLPATIIGGIKIDF